jgi:hypothetical protein
MITMEFDEMKKIWDSQNNEAFYGINEKALHNRIVSKKRTANHITNSSELLTIIVNLGVGCFILAVSLFNHSTNIFMYVLSVWMFSVAMYALVSRISRIKSGHRFDRSLLGDLRDAISVATYQVRFSRLMRWNLLPVGILLIFGMWDLGKSFWFSLILLIFFVLANYASGWEHNIYKKRKRELEILKDKLENEGPDNLPS